MEIIIYNFNNPLEKSDLPSIIYTSFDIKRRMNPEKKN